MKIKQEPLEWDAQKDDVEQRGLVSDWYGGDETSNTILDDDFNAEQLFPGTESKMKQQQQSSQSQQQQQNDSQQQQPQRQKRITAVGQARASDQSAWEERQLVASGVVTSTRTASQPLDDPDADMTTERVQLLVHDVKPPFLDGRQVFTKQQTQVSVVTDPTCDLAVAARQGSTVLAAYREQRDKSQMKDKFWILKGSRMGDIVGAVKSESTTNATSAAELASEAKSAAEAKSDALDLLDPSRLKTQSQFASHLKTSVAQSEFAASKSIRQQREYLPIFGVREQLMQVIRDHPVVVIVGETGSGKTTQLTQYLLEAGYGAQDHARNPKTGLIGCTQPRRVAAMSVAKRVADEQQCSLGSQVGYSIRFETVTSSETRIQYMTDGVLLRESLNANDLSQYSAIIIDEAHERSLNTDMLFGVLRGLLARPVQPEFKLIVTSATLDAERFSSYFGQAPVFTIPGRTFPVDVLYSKHHVEDYVDAAVRQVLTVHLSSDLQGDILVFMTGQDDIEATCHLLEERLLELAEDAKQCGTTQAPLLILPMYSQLPADLQSLIFDPPPAGTRKCIVSTNIAETSLTVDGITHVIDTGFSKMKVYNPRLGMDTLSVTPISQASSNQRAGRAGRTSSGSCYRLYTEHQYRNEMLRAAIPEMQRSNLTAVVLQLKALNVDDLLQFAFLDSPPKDTLLNSMYQLWLLGALDNTGQLTSQGRQLAQFPLDPPLAKMILTASQSEMHCTAELLTIVAMLSVPQIFFRPQNDPKRAQEADAVREKFQVCESDHLTLLHVYQQWLANQCSSVWCTRHYVHAKAMKKVAEVRLQLCDILKELRIPEVSCGLSEWDSVRRCIASAYFHHTAQFKGIGSYVNLRSHLPIHLHPTSALCSLGTQPDFVVYHELVLTSKEFMRNVTQVQPEWLAELGPMFFSLRTSYKDRLEMRRKNQVNKEQMEQQMREKKRKEDEQQALAQRLQLEQEQHLYKSRKRTQVLEAGQTLASKAENQQPTKRRRAKLVVPMPPGLSAE